MKKVIVLTGLSGSGKSSFARRFCAEDPNWLRVNRDDLRRSLLTISLAEYYGTWSEPERNRIEMIVNELQTTALLEALNRGWHVLIDNTNLKLSYINAFRRLLTARYDAVEIRYRLIDTPIEECIQRDKYRDDSVGEAVIRRQADQLTSLNAKFSFQTEILTRHPAFQREQDSSLPRCVLVDIDGTVAIKGDRSPYDWQRVGVDKPKWPIIRLVQSLHSTGYQIVFFSGRDAVCRAETAAWLERYFAWQPMDYALFMRPRNDHRKDSIIKKELFEQHIVGRYFVEFVIDDRQQVVDMWRRTLGLTCLQVDYGDF